MSKAPETFQIGIPNAYETRGSLPVRIRSPVHAEAQRLSIPDRCSNRSSTTSRTRQDVESVPNKPRQGNGLSMVFRSLPKHASDMELRAFPLERSRHGQSHIPCFQVAPTFPDRKERLNLQGAVERGFHWQVVDGNLLAQNRRFT